MRWCVRRAARGRDGALRPIRAVYQSGTGTLAHRRAQPAGASLSCMQAPEAIPLQSRTSEPALSGSAKLKKNAPGASVNHS
jgi:hypothetical protein